MRDPDLHGRSVLVTGGGRGIGRATALSLARCGARVVVVARTDRDIRAVSDAINSSGGQGLAFAADVSREEDVRRLFGAVGQVDILINNASVIGPITPLHAADTGAWMQNIAINLNGVFLMCRYALPGMMERGWGRIINVSSGAARGTTAGWSAYSASKAGLEALTGVVAREGETAGVRANAVRPGIVDTEMQEEIRASGPEQFTPENVERFRGYKERGMLRSPEDPARLIRWLLTPEANHLNGEVVMIDDPDTAARIGLQPMGR